MQRLATVLGPLPSPQTMAQSRTPDQVKAIFAEYGFALSEMGINVVFGPVIDVGGGPGIGTRSFGNDPMAVADYGQAVADGLAESGVVPVFKHFPGHGRASVDTHLGLASTPTLDELRSRDLVPFRKVVGNHMRDNAAVMVAHLLVPGLDVVPASLSSLAIDSLLRAEIGFDGIVFTDALNMGAIASSYLVGDAVEAALRAGADIAIVGSLHDVVPVLDHLEMIVKSDSSFGALVDQRATRVLTLKGEQSICSGVS